MRYISWQGKQPDQAWLDKANRLLAELKAAPDQVARHVIIDKNSDFWGDLKEWLLELSHGKCWFSEAKDCYSHFHVEHYRPKKSAKNENGSEEEGYWWLTFDWKNFRICGSVGNTKKGTYFPLHTSGRRAASPTDDLRYELPLLLDPTDPDDPNLLGFDAFGQATVAPGVADPWERRRVEYSIKRLNLDFPPLVDRRKLIWNECWGRIEQYNQELALLKADPTNVIARHQVRECARHIREMVREERELSSVARACVLSAGDDRLRGLLATV